MKPQLLVIIATLCALNLSAQEIITDRPSQSSTALLVPNGKIQVETGFFSESNESGFSNLNTLVRWGVNDYFELRFQQNYFYIDTEAGKESGWSPTLIGIKSVLAKEKGWVPETAFLGNLQLASGESPLGTQQILGSFVLALGKTISNKSSLGLNVGANWTGGNTTTLSYSLIYSYALLDGLSLFIEPYGYYNKDSKADNRLNYGLTYLIKSNLQVDFSSGVGLVKEAPNTFLSLGAAMIF